MVAPPPPALIHLFILFLNVSLANIILSKEKGHCEGVVCPRLHQVEHNDSQLFQFHSTIRKHGTVQRNQQIKTCVLYQN